MNGHPYSVKHVIRFFHDCKKPKQKHGSYNEKVRTQANSMVNDPPHNGNLQAVVDTPAPAQLNPNSDDDAGWRVVTKRSKDKEKRTNTSAVSNPYALLAM